MVVHRNYLPHYLIFKSEAFSCSDNNMLATSVNYIVAKLKLIEFYYAASFQVG